MAATAGQQGHSKRQSNGEVQVGEEARHFPRREIQLYWGLV